jgi:hypothetical protein
MPTVFRKGPYRFFFYSADSVEPPHVHVEREVRKAKFWLDPVRLEDNQGFGRSELNRIRRLVDENVKNLLRSWNEYFEPQNAGSEGHQGDGD